MGDEKEYSIDLTDIDIGSITVSGSTSDINYDQWMKDYIGAINLDNDDWVYNTEPPLKSDNIKLTSGGEEMLRISEDGFYVRGVKVKQTKREARAVYNAFRRWMTSAIMSGEIDN